MKTTAIRLQEQGTADKMKFETVHLDAPGAGEVLLEQTAIGLNYMDVYQRSGYYPLDLPSGLGLEAAGKILEVGPDVSDIAVGDRVVYGPVLGAYAKHSQMRKKYEGITEFSKRPSVSKSRSSYRLKAHSLKKWQQDV